MRVVRLASFVLLALVWLGLARPVRAETIALIVNGEPAKQPIVENALEPWLAGRQLTVTIGVEDETTSRKLVDCAVMRDPSLCEEWVGKLSFDYTLYVQVDAKLIAGADKIDLTGWLYKGGKFVASQTQICRECRNDTLGPTAEDMAKALFAVQAQGTGRVAITSAPLGAKVLIDGEVVGATPWEQGLRDGPHEVTLELAGYRPYTHKVDVKRDDVVAVDATLVPIPPVGGGGAKKRNPLWLGVAGVGVVAALGGGVLVFAIDEDEESIPVTQKTYVDTALGGGVLMGVGVAAIAAGAYLYFTSGKPAAAAKPTAWLDGRGGGVGVAGAF